VPQIGPLEILVVAVIALIVFGPDKLPDMARSLGRAASELRRMATEVRDEFASGLDEEEPPEPQPEPEPNGQEAPDDEGGAPPVGEA
jgi:Tat protein translocase TatB subunit